jgi:hypothetical protein
MSGKYQVFEPGKYLDWEKAAIEERLAIAAKDPPKGLGAKTEVINEYELLDYNRKWEPYNPLFGNREYARKAGYPDVPAWPCFRAPFEAIMAVMVPHNLSNIFILGHGPNDVEFFAPIFPGDTLTTETEKLMFEELTVPGSTYRHFRNGCIMRTYNQKGELVVRSTLWRREAYRKIIDGSLPPVEERWQSPPHYTTDEEWEYIKELWRKEYIRGGDTLYWEDVKVGDEPTWTCSGPITYMDMARWYGGSRIPDGRETIMKGAHGVFRDRFGQYLVGVAAMNGGMNVPGERATCFNDTCAKLITRMVTNYVGDAGFVTRIGWIFTRNPKMLPSEEEFQFPKFDIEYFNKVPYMKGKACTIHPFETDTVIAKGYVTDKYINDRGEHIIDLVCWGETLDRRIVEVVPAAAKLPSKGG